MSIIKIMRSASTPDWSPTLRVRLDACWLGRFPDGFAQQLANKLNAVVIASPVRTITDGPNSYGPYYTFDHWSNDKLAIPIMPASWQEFSPVRKK